MIVPADGIAAIARQYDLAVAIRNSVDNAGSGLEVIDPPDDPPDDQPHR